MVGPEGNCSGHTASMKDLQGSRTRKGKLQEDIHTCGAICLSVALHYRIARYELH